MVIRLLSGPWKWSCTKDKHHDWVSLVSFVNELFTVKEENRMANFLKNSIIAQVIAALIATLIAILLLRISKHIPALSFLSKNFPVTFLCILIGLLIFISLLIGLVNMAIKARRN